MADRQILTTVKAVAGYFAMWAVRQSPYPCPDNLEKVLRRLERQLTKYAKDRPGANSLMKAEGMFRIDRRSLQEMLLDVLRPMREFQRWNQRKNGNKDTLHFVSRYDDPRKIDPDNEFIDLDALVRNVAMSVEQEDKVDSFRGSKRSSNLTRVRRSGAAVK